MGPRDLSPAPLPIGTMWCHIHVPSHMMGCGLCGCQPPCSSTYAPTAARSGLQFPLHGRTHHGTEPVTCLGSLGLRCQTPATHQNLRWREQAHTSQTLCKWAVSPSQGATTLQAVLPVPLVFPSACWSCLIPIHLPTSSGITEQVLGTILLILGSVSWSPQWEKGIGLRWLIMLNT